MDLLTNKQAMELIKGGRADEVKATKHKYYKKGLFPWESKQKQENKPREWSDKNVHRNRPYTNRKSEQTTGATGERFRGTEKTERESKERTRARVKAWEDRKLSKE